MDRVRVFYDASGGTLSVWVADPESEDVCEETEGDTILLKDANGEIMGLEKFDVERRSGPGGLIVEVIGP